jgi:hypothetical protein
MKPELITRCDNCDMPIDLDKAITVELSNADEHERWTLCKPCCRNHTLNDIARTINAKTAQA